MHRANRRGKRTRFQRVTDFAIDLLVSSLGGAVIETALVFPILIYTTFMGCQFGLILIEDIIMTNSASSGARFAILYPTTWDSSASPSSNSIQGVILNSGAAFIPNNDAHIGINYGILGAGSTPTPCGHYVASSSSFVAYTGYTQATCIIPGSLITINVTNTYTGTLLAPSFTITATEALPEVN